MTEYHIELFFDRNVSSDLVKKVNSEFVKLKVYRINTTDFMIMRTKLVHIPIIMATAIYGPPKVEHRKLSWGSFAWNLYTESQSYLSRLEPDGHFTTVFAWRWSDEDQKAYEMLSSKVDVKIEPVPWERPPKKHVFWPVAVFDLEEVEKEVERIRKDVLFLPDVPHDVELVKEYKKSSNLEEYVYKKYKEELGKGSDEATKYIVIEADRMIRERMIRLCDMLTKTREVVKSIFWFTFYYPK